MPGTDVSYAHCLLGRLLSVAQGKGIDGLCVGRRKREVAAYGVSLVEVQVFDQCVDVGRGHTEFGKRHGHTDAVQEVLEKLGFTATEVAQRMQEDSQTMILELLGAIQKLPEAERAAAISNYLKKTVFFP